MSILTDLLLLVGIATGVYSVMDRNSKRRRVIAHRVMLLAISGVLLSEAHAHTGWMRWMNLVTGLFAIVSVIWQVVRDRRRGVSESLPGGVRSHSAD